MLDKGLQIKKNIVQSSIHYLNPILITILTANLTLIPLAFTKDEHKNKIQSTMAVIILGGLLTSTLLNVYVILIVYLLLNSKKK